MIRLPKCCVPRKEFLRAIIASMQICIHDNYFNRCLSKRQPWSRSLSELEASTLTRCKHGTSDSIILGLGPLKMTLSRGNLRVGGLVSQSPTQCSALIYVSSNVCKPSNKRGSPKDRITFSICRLFASILQHIFEHWLWSFPQRGEGISSANGHSLPKKLPRVRCDNANAKPEY